jgi:hypothetical protein
VNFNTQYFRAVAGADLSGMNNQHPNQHEHQSQEVRGPLGPCIAADQLGHYRPEASDCEPGAHQGVIGSNAGHPGTLKRLFY